MANTGIPSTIYSKPPKGNRKPKAEVPTKVKTDVDILDDVTSSDDGSGLLLDEEDTLPITTTRLTPTMLEMEAKKEGAKDAKKLRELPIPPAKRGDYNTFKPWLDSLDRDLHWSHILVYVYRTKPVIDRIVANPTNPKYIDVISEPFDHSYFVTKHGGGKYILHVTDTDGGMNDRTPHGRTGNKQVAEILVSVDNSIDPILDLRELVIEDRDNIPYVNNLRARGLLDVNNKPMGTQPQLDAVGLVKEISNVFTNLNKQQQDSIRASLAKDNESNIGREFSGLLLEHMKQQDPSKQVATLISLMQVMKEGTTKDGSNVELLMKFMDVQMKTQELMMAQMTKTIESLKQPPPNTDPFDQIGKILDIQERLGGNNQGRHKQDTFDRLVEVGERLGMPLIQSLVNFFALKQSGLTPEQIRAMQANPTQGMSATPVPALPASTTQVSGMNPGTPDVTELQQFLLSYGNLIIQKMTEMSGWEYANSMIAMYGVPMHAQIAKFGTDTIVATFCGIPELNNVVPSLGGTERVRQWIDDFINYQQAEMRDEANTDPNAGGVGGYQKFN